MKIDYEQKLFSVDGTPVVESADTPLTLKRTCLAALLNFRPLRSGESLTLEEQLKRFALAGKVEKEKELKSDEVVIIKNAIAHWFQNPIVTGAAILALEPGVEDE